MVLKKKRTMGFNKFQCLVQLLLLVLQVAVVGLADADARSYDIQYDVQWITDPLVVMDFELHELQVPKEFQLWRKLIGKLRGGRLGGGRGRGNKRKARADVEVDDINRNETDSSTSTTSTIVKDKKKSKHQKDYSKSQFAFELFQKNDGSQTDRDGLPRRYIAMQKNDREKAKKALDATLQWREEHDVNTILARPNPKFEVCKKVFPHYFCGRDDSGHVILLQRPGLIDLKLAEKNGLTGEDLLWHYVYENEYLWQILEPSADGLMTSVIDLTGVNLSILRKPELLKVVNMFCSTMDAHFPQRAHKTLLINAPKWFGTLYKLISPLLRESTKEKITIYSKGKAQDAAIAQLLSKEYDNTDGIQITDMPPNDMETELHNFVLARLSESHVEMQKVRS